MTGSPVIAWLACSTLAAPVPSAADASRAAPDATVRAATTADAAAIVRALHGGRFADALAAIRAAASTGSVSVPELTLLAAVVMESWLPAAPLNPARLEHADRATYWYVYGVLAARAAWPGGRAEEVQQARGAAAQLEQLTADSGGWNRSGVRRASILAAVAAAQEERPELTLLLAHVLHLDGQLREIGIADDPVLPADELAGDLWLQVHRYADALAHYRVVTSRHPERTRAWIGRARAAQGTGERREAAEAARQVLDAYAEAPGHARLRDEMRAIADAATP